MKAHPYADLFPMMADDELRKLADDIKANGLREPVTTLDGDILDGRNRRRACEIAGVDPRSEPYCGSDPLAFVLSRNLHRRHLSESQRGMVASRLATLSQGRPIGDETKPANLPVLPPSQSKSAELLNVSERTVRTAKQVQRDGIPELAAAVDSGEVSLNAAAEVAKLPKEEQMKVVEKGPAEVKKAAAKQRQSKPTQSLPPPSPSPPPGRKEKPGPLPPSTTVVCPHCQGFGRIPKTAADAEGHH